MRDPNRIPQLLQHVQRVWQQYPDLRFGQFVLNVAGTHDPWHLEEAEWARLLNEFLTKHPPRQR